MTQIQRKRKLKVVSKQTSELQRSWDEITTKWESVRPFSSHPVGTSLKTRKKSNTQQ